MRPAPTSGRVDRVKDAGLARPRPRRPDGRRQVAFKGAPLYRFVQDMKAGNVKGNGFRDVGIWRPAVARGSATQAPAPAPAPSNYGY